MLHTLSLADAQQLKDGQPPAALISGYPSDQLRQSADVLIGNPETRTIFLIEHGDNGIIGFVAVDLDQQRPDEAMLSFVDIAEPLHEQRFASEALRAVIGWTIEQGVRLLFAEIAPDNPPARNLVARAGFCRGGRPAEKGGFEVWERPAGFESDAAERRVRLRYIFSSAIDLDQALADIEPFYRPFADQRSKPGRPTGHRLIRLVESVETDRDALSRGLAGEYLPEVVELRQVAKTLTGWSGHPVGAKITGNLKDPATYEHNVLVLAAARLLHSWENQVELVEEADLPTCDLKVRVGEATVGSELKTPAEMRQARHITADEAAKIAERVLRKSRRQRRTEASVVLIVGGYQVPAASLEILAVALHTELAKSSARSNIAGAIAMTLGRHPDDVPTTIPSDTPFEGVYAQFAGHLNPAIFQTGVAARIARNSRYDGPVPVLGYREPGAGLHLP